MKRLFAIGLMLASAFALTNCAEELVGPDIFEDQLTKDETNASGNEGVPFKIYASIESAAETKTVTQKNGTSLKTVWVEGDKILGFYEKDGMLAETPIEFTVDPANLAAGEFTADVQNENLKTILNDEGSKYNWYFVYGYTGYTASAGLATINIPNVQSQNPSEEVAHIGGQSCPMYGQALNLSGPIFPRVTMKHLATLHEVTVRNNTQANTVSGATAGNIVLYNLGMSIATTGIWNKSNRISLAGNFQLNLKDGTLKNYSSNVDNIILKLPSTGVTIAPGNTNNESKFYFVTAPIDKLQTGATYISYYRNGNKVVTQSGYDALADKSGYTNITEEVGILLYKNRSNANDVLTESGYNSLSDKSNYTAFYTPEIDRQDIFAFSANGSARTVPAVKTYDGFDGGALKRFILPIKEMSYPLHSDALDLKWSDALSGETNQPVVTFLDSEPIDITINGTLRNDVWKVGTTDKAGTIIIKGFAKDLINALPAGFYASQLNNQPTAMALKYIKIWMPEYTGTYQLSKRTELKDYYMTVPVKTFLGTITIPMKMSTIGAVLGMSFDNGITLDGLVNGIGVDRNTLTFNGLVPNGANDRLLIMDESPVYKEMTNDLVQSFLVRFSTDNYKATLDGVKAIVNAQVGSDGTLTFPTGIADADQKANDTAAAIIDKLRQVVGTGEVGLQGIATVPLAEAVSPYMFKNSTDLMFKLRDMKFELAIETVPYSSSHTIQPMLIWGLDMNAPTLQ